MAMVLTQVYLDARQRKALAARAKRSGRKSSDLVREAVDALLLGVNTDELKQLDEATKLAQTDIAAMVEALDANAERHRSFMSEIAAMRRAEAIESDDYLAPRIPRTTKLRSAR